MRKQRNYGTQMNDREDTEVVGLWLENGNSG